MLKDRVRNKLWWPLLGILLLFGALFSVLNVAPPAAAQSTLTLTVAERDSSLALSWNSVAGTFGYRVDYKDSGMSTWNNATEISATSHTISSLTNGTEYNVRVTALSANGPVLAETESSGVPRTVPGAPGLTSVNRAGAGSLDVNWTTDVALTNDGGAPVTDYKLEWQKESEINWNNPSSMTVAARSGVTSQSQQITGLENGARYNVRVKAVNEAGAGLPSDLLTVMVGQLPTAPLTTQLAYGSSSLSVSWDPPLDLGTPTLESYEVEWATEASATEQHAGVQWETWNNSRTAIVGGSTNYLITGLNDFTDYKVRVFASNVIGGSPPSNTAVQHPIPAPVSAPKNISLSTGSDERTIVVRFDPPDEADKYAVDLYTIEYKYHDQSWGDSSSFETFTSSPATLTGLRRGLHDIRVSAANQSGWGPTSEEDSELAEGLTEDPPTLVSVNVHEQHDNRIIVNWRAPNALFPEFITSFRIYYKQSSEDWSDSSVVEHTDTDSTQRSIRNLPYGTYDVLMLTVNDEGEGSTSEEHRVKVWTIPGEPQDVSVSTYIADSGKYNTITVTDWSLPVSDGGTPVIKYHFQIKGSDADWPDLDTGKTRRVANTSLVSFDDLEAGISYDVRAVAINRHGRGPAVEVTGIVPIGNPQTPSDLESSVTGDSIALSWTHPTNTGGLDLTKYIVRWKESTMDWSANSQELAASSTSHTLSNLESAPLMMCVCTQRTSLAKALTLPRQQLLLGRCRRNLRA